MLITQVAVENNTGLPLQLQDVAKRRMIALVAADLDIDPEYIDTLTIRRSKFLKHRCKNCHREAFLIGVGLTDGWGFFDKIVDWCPQCNSVDFLREVGPFSMLFD